MTETLAKCKIKNIEKIKIKYNLDELDSVRAEGKEKMDLRNRLNMGKHDWPEQAFDLSEMIIKSFDFKLQRNK